MLCCAVGSAAAQELRNCAVRHRASCQGPCCCAVAGAVASDVVATAIWTALLELLDGHGAAQAAAAAAANTCIRRPNSVGACQMCALLLHLLVQVPLGALKLTLYAAVSAGLTTAAASPQCIQLDLLALLLLLEHALECTLLAASLIWVVPVMTHGHAGPHPAIL